MKYNVIMLTIASPYSVAEEPVHPVLLQDGKDNILIDCGFVGSLPAIEEELQRHGVNAADITGIVLTHQDHDHMGAAAAFKKKYPAVRIFASEAEAPYISGETKSLRLMQAEEMQKNLPPEQQAFGKAFCAMLKTVEPVPVDVRLHDQDDLGWCGGCEVIAAPGHTPGHIALYLKAHRTMIAGDAIALHEGRPVIANPQFTLNIDAAKASISKLLAMDAETIICYHGGMLQV